MGREVLFLRTVPFGNDLIFDATNYGTFQFMSRFAKTLDPDPPSTYAALAGATV